MDPCKTTTIAASDSALIADSSAYSQISSTVIPCTECDKNGSGSGQYQAVDEYPADDVEADRENSAHSGHLSLMQSDDMTQSFNGYSEMSSSVCPKTESGLFEEHAYEKQHCELSTSRFWLERLQPIHGHEDSGEIAEEASNELVENMAQLDLEGENHHGKQRRWLRFEDAQQNIMESCPGLKMLSRQLVDLTQPITSTISPRNSGNHKFEVSKPSGTGLHLNSIVSAMQMGLGASGSMKSVEKGHVNVHGRSNHSMLLNVSEKLSASCEDGIHETQALVATSSLASQSPKMEKSSNYPALLKPSEYMTTPCGKRTSTSEHAHAVKELNQSSAQNRRKTTSTKNDKRCNCKQSRCLKLYCECFAAEFYCSQYCACQGCLNRFESRDRVEMAVEEIKSRNEHAFESKIEDVNNATSSPARHKRGCNCQKSKCIKNYCECYQANVGCSKACRCEGCENMYDRKEGS